MEVFPADPFSRDDIKSMIRELVNNKLLTEYTVNGRSYWKVSGWNHQKIDQPTYYHPGPDGIIPKGPAKRRKGSESSPNTPRPLDECSPQEKEKEKEKEVIKENSPKTKAKTFSTDRERGFIEFWNAVAFKVKRKHALKSWVKNKCADQADEIIDAYLYQLSFRLQYQDKQMIPMPSTWLNNAQWQDTGYPETNYQPPGTNNETNKSIFKTRNQTTADAITQAVIADYQPTIRENGGHLRERMAQSISDDGTFKPVEI
jgi:hypothetical protein